MTAINSLRTEEVQAITTEQAWRYRIIPKELLQDAMAFYIDQECNMDTTLEELEVLFGKSISLEPIASDLILNSLSHYYRREKSNNGREVKVASLDPTSNNFLRNLIAEAKGLGSSDIHIESYEQRCRIRIRIDGLMVERYVIAKNEYPSLINKIKIQANLDIAEKRLPQDGRIFFGADGQQGQMDIRVSVLPTLHGEKVVLRLLSNDAFNVDITRLGFYEDDLLNYMEGIKRPNGVILISGPTGSGKTTTLYATLKLLNKISRNILTIEDPIEYTLEGINQVQLKESIGLNFGSALRTFLRQDPDVIMVGEIRDPDTASMAIRASLTGHLVLSTIHTNSAWGTVSRLVDMGVPPFLIASTLNTTVAQRLVRILCPRCKSPEVFDKSLYPRQFVPYRQVNNHFVATGCHECYFTGYKGRKAVYEVIQIDAELGSYIKKGETDISEALKIRRVKTLAQNAFELFEKGETSIEEIYPLLYSF